MGMLSVLHVVDCVVMVVLRRSLPLRHQLHVLVVRLGHDHAAAAKRRASLGWGGLARWASRHGNRAVWYAAQGRRFLVNASSLVTVTTVDTTSASVILIV